jgi:CRP-like cAMP-binding protein
MAMQSEKAPSQIKEIKPSPSGTEKRLSDLGISWHIAEEVIPQGRSQILTRTADLQGRQNMVEFSAPQTRFMQILLLLNDNEFVTAKTIARLHALTFGPGAFDQGDIWRAAEQIESKLAKSFDLRIRRIKLPSKSPLRYKLGYRLEANDGKENDDSALVNENERIIPLMLDLTRKNQALRWERKSQKRSRVQVEKKEKAERVFSTSFNKGAFFRAAQIAEEKNKSVYAMKGSSALAFVPKTKS